MASSSPPWRPDVEALRREILATSHAVAARGWVANHDGNLSARLDPPGDDGGLRVLCTPTAMHKGDVRAEHLIVADGERRVLEGSRHAFSELALHVAAYRARPDIGVVLHAHPPHATAFAVAGQPVPHPFTAEAVVSLGPDLPTVPFHLPGDPALDADLAAALQRADVVVLARHGLLSVGGSFEQALLRMELVEHLARTALAAGPLGGPQLLSADQIATLSAKGRPASDPARAAAPAEPAAETTSAPSPRAASQDVRSVVEEALARFR
ncbi:MAG: class II aldolase/adducin family protein [Alphaproteobacteria bacterium]|nr:class II aldolase/adducin family protein [Alphaproteobacteria bacterium]